MPKNSSDLLKIPEIELIYKSKVKASERIKVQKSEDVYSVLISYWDSNKIDFVEEFKVLLLNRAKRVLGIVEISKGGMTGTVVDLRLIFVAAIKVGAVAIIISHNHPSGNLTPSRSDEEITEKIRQGGKLLDIELTDHIIISSEGYYSFADEGNL